jgi:hypothetical protein
MGNHDLPARPFRRITQTVDHATLEFRPDQFHKGLDQSLLVVNVGCIEQLLEHVSVAMIFLA